MRYFVDGKRATLHDAQRALRGGQVVPAQHQRGATVSTYAGRHTKEGWEVWIVDEDGIRMKYAQNVADVLAIMRKGGEISPPS